MNQIDLHMHSVQSNDGTYSPEELLELAQTAGLRTIAIADHNSIRSIRPAMEQSAQYGITVVPAIEIDCTYQTINLHVLGYWIDPEDPAFLELEDRLAQKERDSSQERIRLVHELGIAFSETEARAIAHYGYVTGEVIAEVALKTAANDDNELLRPYRPGGSRSDNPYVNFYWDYCAPGKPAYVHIPFISLAEALKLIRGSGGVPVLAHPGNNIPMENKELLHEILDQGIAGMEVFSTYHSKAQKDFYYGIARERNMFFTAGSDFHGKTKPAISLGQLALDGLEEEIACAILKYRRDC